MSDAQLQALYQDVLKRRGTPSSDRAACAAPERLLDLVERRGAEDERLRTLDHVMSCAACKREFDLLQSVTASGREAARRRFVVPFAIAASLALAVSGTLLWKALGGRDDVFRGGETEIQLVAPGSGATVALPAQLTWRAVPGGAAAEYRVEVLDAQGRPVLTAVSRDTMALLPAAGMVAGAEYQWWVRAALRDGGERRSQVSRFRLAER